MDHLVGRVAELDRLLGVLGSLGRGRSAAVELIGPAGIGKTRLLAEFGERVEADGVLVLGGRGAEQERDLPFWVFVDALDDYVRGLEPRRLRGLAEEVRADLGEVFPSPSTLKRIVRPDASTARGCSRTPWRLRRVRGFEPIRVSLPSSRRPSRGDPSSVRAGRHRCPVQPGRRPRARAPHPRPGLSADVNPGRPGAGQPVTGRAVRHAPDQPGPGLGSRADHRLSTCRTGQNALVHRRDQHGGARRRRPGRLRLPNAPGGRERGARTLPRMRHEAAGDRGTRHHLHMPHAPGGRERAAGALPRVWDEAAALASRRRRRRTSRART